MKKILIDELPKDAPEELRFFASRSHIYDSSCSPEAKVYFIDRDTGYYLKRAQHASLETEANLTQFFYTHGIGAEVLSYNAAEEDWLLTRALPGEDCVHEIYLGDPKRLCDTIAQELRRLHELNISSCPVPDRMTNYFALAESNYRTGKFDRSLFSGEFAYQSAEDAYTVLREGKDALKDRVLLHGDYCLPNIILDDWQLAGFVDVGCGGIGDRHLDLFWGAWTLNFNLKTDAYRKRFFDAYGRDKVDESLLQVIAAAEVFG